LASGPTRAEIIRIEHFPEKEPMVGTVVKDAQFEIGRNGLESEVRISVWRNRE